MEYLYINTLVYTHLIEVIIFIFGICIGSFLNVCIYRLPISKSLINPLYSVCPNCNKTIKFYDNIPIFGYLFLMGRCRNCNQLISLRYPMIEIISGLFAVCVLLKFGLTYQGIVYYIFITTLIIITFIDIDYQIIPDILTLPGIPICFFCALFLPTMSYKDSLIGILSGAGSLYLIGWIYYMVKNKIGMGGGDIKLLGMIGALVGYKGVFVTIFVGSFLGTLSGIIIILYTRNLKMNRPIPFGPFLSLGAMTYIFWGERLINWYWYYQIP